MGFRDTNKKNFYVIIIILTISINLMSVIASKYIGMNLNLSGILVFWLCVLILTYGLKFAFWFILHRKFKLSFIYPFLSLNYFFSLLLGKILFAEPITLRKIIGSVVIVAGVFVIALSGKKMEEV